MSLFRDLRIAFRHLLKSPGFAATAVLMLALGIAPRVQEMAIRMALGSQRSGIVGLILASGAKLAAAGCVLGLIGAVGASRLLLSMALAAVLVLLLALAASMLPRCFHQSRGGSARPVAAGRPNAEPGCGI